MGKKQDLTNQRFGKLVAIRYIGDSKWFCQCDCGNTTEVKTSSLNSGKTKSCGCLRGKNLKNNIRKSKPKEDLTNKKFGKLTPQYYIKGGKWFCKCDCGNTCIIDTRNLNSGHTQSCGCLQKEKAQNNVVDMTGYETDTLKVLERVGSTDKQQKALWKCLCKNCGNIFITTGQHIRSGDAQSCGCVHSLNEQKIIKLLIENNIPFATQYTFSDLKGPKGGALRFDFALFKNEQLVCLIEYNGQQHYQKAEGFWGENFDYLKICDNQKIKYCKDHNIPLLIIPYWEKYTIYTLLKFYEPVETIPSEIGSTTIIDT